MNERQFPAVQRSRITVASSGISGSGNHPLQNAQSTRRPYERTPTISLYEVGSERVTGICAVDDLKSLVLKNSLPEYTFGHITGFSSTNRPAPPPIKDWEARIKRLPRKSVMVGKSKRKKRKKARKINEQKRQRHFTPNPDEQQHNQPPRSPSQSLARRPRGTHATPSLRLSANPRPLNERDSSATLTEEFRRPHSRQTVGFLQRARKTVVERPLVPSATPPPPPFDRRSYALTLDAIAQSIIRLDSALVRYSFRSAPLFLRRNLRDGWVGKVRSLDNAGVVSAPPDAEADRLRSSYQRLENFMEHARYRVSNAMADTTRFPLPRTFCVKLKGFELGDLAKTGIPDSAQVAAMLYIHNPSDRPLAFDLGVLPLDIPHSPTNIFSMPIRLPPLELSNTRYHRPNTLAPFYVQNPGQGDGNNVSLRALALPGGIAYIDLLLYDFVDNSMSLRNIVGTWGPSNASQLYARVELFGPNAGLNGYTSSTQRAPLTWLRSDPSNDSNENASVRTEYQPRAFLRVDVEWGVDSAARLLHTRAPKIPPQHLITPPKDVLLKYHLTVQGGQHALERDMPPWACVLCDICAPFPTRQVLKAHLQRAHPLVETKFGKGQRDLTANKETFDVRMLLPPEAIELSDDEEEAQVPKEARSTQIGVLLAIQEGHDSPTPEPELERPFTSTTPPLITDAFQPDTNTNNLAEPRAATPPLIMPNVIKQEEDLNLQDYPLVLLPIARGRSHSPTPVPLDSPVRRRRGYSMGSHRRSSPTRPDVSPTRSAVLRDGMLGPYSSRINNERQVYDVLRDLPTREFGVLAEQVVASEEELFAYDFAADWRASDQDSFDRARLLASLWSRWVTQGRNKFIKSPFECINKFFESFYLGAIIDVGVEQVRRFLLAMGLRRMINPKQTAALMLKYQRCAEDLTQRRRALVEDIEY
ncbi:hypothetical protein BDV93DRAFT_543148 [Ceratobasidium sp. AG-I]|nr:hypothetical protein BDV93DRAFT_543148 [Ceratobasidium sp. AG-I]